MPELPRADLSALSDLATPWCIRVAATLQIADHIAAGATGISDLAAAAGCDADWLGRVLRHLVGKGVFLETAPGQFALNDVAQEFFHPMNRLYLDLNGIGGRLAYAWGTLPTVVRTGASAYHEQFGLPFWEDLVAHPEIGASFDAFMGSAGHGAPNPNFQIVDGWDTVQHIVDVGGGTGAMLAAILQARPALRGTLVELPQTVARSAPIFQEAGVADRVSVAGQSFFEPLPAGADLYLLKSVLNDWPDKETVAILRRCAEAALPNGRVVVLGGVMPDSAGSSQTVEIDMIVAGGKTNTLTEFRELARQAGLDIIAAEKQPSHSFVVECRPLE
jgi:2,7-dihydroxy-5-methyl-1-naphthoate 7-O-methyltransferase